VELLMHGRPYFARLYARLEEMQAGDWVHFADWRGDPDQELIDGEEFAEVLVGLVKRGVKVRGMVWRSHPKVAGFHLEHHLELSQQINDAGGLVLLDRGFGRRVPPPSWAARALHAGGGCTLRRRSTSVMGAACPPPR
jgi:hypothetical protein